MRDTYLALTTGPIYETLKLARSTRALWAASYLFSFLMKNVIDKFRDTHTFLVPYVGDDRLFNEPLECGLFHDRFIFKQNEEDDFGKLKKVVEDEIDAIASGMAADLGADVVNVQNQMRHHLRNCLLKAEVPEDKNPIEVIDGLLDSQELQPMFNPVEQRNHLKDFIELKMSKQQRSFLVNHAFSTLIAVGKNDEVRFESILEITTAELSTPIFISNKGKYWEIFKDNPNKKDKDRFEEMLADTSNHGKELMRHHKYLAVLQADGDHLGQLIQQLFQAGTGDVSKRFEGLSRALFAYDLKAMEVMETYGAMPVYVGGDDILCLAPLRNNGKNIFDLIEQLDNAFRDEVVGAKDLQSALSKVSNRLTMTYGVSISYYKHPMNEALDEAFHQMRNIAKEKRNAVSFRLLKHSGSHFGACFRKPQNPADENEETLYRDHFLKLLGMPLEDGQGHEKAGSFLSSLQYKLKANHGVLDAILHDESAVDQFFINNFNESVHRNSEFIKAVCAAVKQVWKEFDREALPLEEKKKQTIATIHAMLRYVQFIGQKAKDE